MVPFDLSPDLVPDGISEGSLVSGGLWSYTMKTGGLDTLVSGDDKFDESTPRNTTVGVF